MRTDAYKNMPPFFVHILQLHVTASVFPLMSGCSNLKTNFRQWQAPEYDFVFEPDFQFSGVDVSDMV